MTYYKISLKNKEKEKKSISIIYKCFIFFIRRIIPVVNPDFEDRYESVINWYVEYDSRRNFVNREIGLNSNNIPIVIAPYKKNLGFWVDSDVIEEQINNLNSKAISESEFNNKWEEFLISSD